MLESYQDTLEDDDGDIFYTDPEKLETHIKYSDVFVERPPLNFRPDQNPPYKERDETLIFLLQEAIFSGKLFPVPSPNLPQEHPSRHFYNKLRLAHGRLQNSINALEPYRAQKEFRDEAIKSAGLESNDGKESASTQYRRIRSEHFFFKKAFFEATIAYLAVCASCPDFSDKTRQESTLRMDMVEAMYYGHINYQLTLGAFEDCCPVRDSGELSVDHSYNIAVQRFNSLFPRFFDAETFEEKRKILHKLKINILAALNHDSPEDSTLERQDMGEKICQYFNHDSRILTALRSTNYKLPDLYFVRTHIDEVLDIIFALKKPKNRNERKGYLKRQIQTADECAIKIADKIDNLHDLKKKIGNPRKGENATQTQLRNTKDGITIYGIGCKFLKEDINGDIRSSLISLCIHALEEIKRIKTTEPHIQTAKECGMEKDILATEQKFTRFLEALKKAA
ncbi:hypothetical protein KKC94_03830 [Patescibacteria group bacterium]|nr:hypothetical protein [Patescibacteria group bacterium]